MGGTITQDTSLSVREARELLRNTTRQPADRIDAAERVLAAWSASRPRNRACVACSAMVWEERTTATGDPVWCCVGCGRRADLSAEAWHAQCAAAQAHQKAEDARLAAAAPEPRAALAEALERRAGAAGALDRLEQALPAARAALAAAQARHDAATEAVAAAERTAVARAAAALSGDPLPALGTTSSAARGQLRAAEDALAAARGARQLLDDRLLDARRAVTGAEAAVRGAALRVLADQELEPLLAAAVAARADYVEAIGCLGWLIRNHCVPSGDIRPNQLVAEAGETPPAYWPEAPGAGSRLAAKLALLEEFP